MNDLDTLRPEVREAMSRIEAGFQCDDDHRTVRAELLRLAKIEEERWAVVATRNGALERAEHAEAELAALKARIDGSRHAFLGPNMDRITFLAEDIGPVGKYALVKVEDWRCSIRNSQRPARS